jgi:hypothetical protein
MHRRPETDKETNMEEGKWAKEEIICDELKKA